MFGYIAANLEEMKLKDYRIYRAFYCGICQDLKEYHGQISRTTLTYDMTFLAILLEGLYEPEEERGAYSCAAHPFQKHPSIRSEVTAYAADMNVLISYFNLLDDWEDDRKILPLMAAGFMKRDMHRLCGKYPRQIKAIRRYLVKLKACEEEHSPDLDRASGDTGELMAEIFQWKEDHWVPTLRQIGYYIGKFIYLMDAYDDVEKDRKAGNYNPWLGIAGEKDFRERAEEILVLLAAQCSREFEKLPIIEYVDILRNILYSGIWTKYNNMENKKKEKTGKIRTCNTPVKL